LFSPLVGVTAEFLAVKWKLHPWQKIVKYGFSFGVAAGMVWYGLSQGVSLYSVIFMVSGVVIGGLLLIKKDRFPGMDVLKFGSAAAAVALGVLVVMNPENSMLYWALVGVGGVLGVVLTLSIGGADMPVVIALLNSYSGLAAAATGFVINNTVLIIAGSLVGASGLILTSIMCKAMNRSLANVLFGTMGPTADTPDADEVYKSVKTASAEEIAMILEMAERVVIVPGYGMAVAQAQHAVRDFASNLEGRGINVEYAIHPVAGRMPGHMNVLLAEANVPYDEVFELEDINSEFSQSDAVYVIGANDVVNPAAEDDPGSPIYGMPVLQIWKAGTVLFNKRSLASGYAGIDNPVFYRDNTIMVLGDAKKMTEEIAKSVSD